MADNELSYDEIIKLVNKADEDEKERRKKRDWLTIMPIILSLTAFVMVIAVWFMLDYAAPPRYYGWLTLFEVYTPQDGKWNKDLVNTSYIMLIVSMLMCVIAFICNTRRMKRKGDKYRVSIFLVGSIVLITLVFFLVQFLPMGIIGL